MKFKKILAVALAATTALSSGVAYDALSFSSAFAKEQIGVDKDDTFTVETSNTIYTYTVSDAAYKTATTGGNVKLTNVESNDSDVELRKFTVPSVAVYDNGTKDDTNDDVAYNVTGIELDGSTFSDLSMLTEVNINDATNLKKVEMKNFEDSGIKFNLANTTDTATKVSAVLEDVDFTNSHVSFTAVKGFIDKANGSLKTLKLKTLGANDESKASDKVMDLTDYPKLKTVDLSDNDILTTVKVNRGFATNALATTTASYGGPHALTLNINGDTNIETLEAKGKYTRGVMNGKGALEGNNKGITFITDDSEEGSSKVDLSAYSIKHLTINGAGIESLVLPGDTIDADVSGNLLKTLDASAASDMTKLNASNNLIMDVDIAGCGELNNLDLSDNFLTALDVSNCEKLKSGAVAKNNFIPKDNFTKASSGQSGLSLGDQAKPGVVAMGLTGDAGLKSNKGDSATGIIKIGGTANVVAAFVVFGAPEGFAEKYAETITWKEANENGGAISLGEASVLGTQYKFDGNGNKYNYGQARVFVTAPVTAADAKAPQEKITITAGNVKNTLSVQADNAVIVSYDTATNLPTNKIGDEGDNQYLKEFSMVFAPQQAGIIPSNGTVSIKLDSCLPKFDAFDKLKGVQLENWNTSADGTGTSYKFSGKDKGKTIKITEDTALTAIYKEKTFTVQFDKNTSQKGVDKTSGSSPAAMKNLAWGEEASLSSNGWSSSAKEIGTSNDYIDNAFMTWVDNKDASSKKAFDDGTMVFGGKLGMASAYKDKKDTAKLKALWSNANYSMTFDENSISLVLDDQTKNTYDIGDLGTKIDGSDEAADDAKLDKNLTAYTNDDGIVGVAEYTVNKDTYTTLYAKGEGTATVYIYDQANGVVGTVTVNVSKDGATSEDKLADLAAGKAVKAENGETVVLNKDGKTVTLKKGTNKKKVTINTIVIDGVTYKVTAIGANAFKGMSKIQTVVIGNNVKTIGKLAFANCKKLSKVTMGKNVKKIGAKAFKNDKKLAKVLIKSKKLTKNSTVASQAFKNTKSGCKFYIAKKAATFKKIKKVIKKKGQPTKAVYKKKFA